MFNRAGPGGNGVPSPFGGLKRIFSSKKEIAGGAAAAPHAFASPAPPASSPRAAAPASADNDLQRLFSAAQRHVSDLARMQARLWTLRLQSPEAVLTPLCLPAASAGCRCSGAGYRDQDRRCACPAQGAAAHACLLRCGTSASGHSCGTTREVARAACALGLTSGVFRREQCGKSRASSTDCPRRTRSSCGRSARPP